MRRLLYIIGIFVIVALAVPVEAYGRIGAAVTGRLIDAETQEGVIGAVIEVTSVAAPEQRRHFTSEFKGEFVLHSLAEGNYRGVATFVGYRDVEFTFSVSGLAKDIGRIIIHQAPIDVAPVVVEAVGPRATIVGDTLRYRASNFKVAADAEVDALLTKMPGISIHNGKIEAQGEVVNKVYVDDQELFGGNIQQVLQSIPAQLVDRIEVYNRLSESSQITGVDDGEGGKVINIITKGGLSHSEFGKMHAGVGYEPTAKPDITSKLKYTAGGSVNIFRGDRRISIMALANNMNKQNLSDDGVSVSGSTSSGNASRQFSVNRQSGVSEAQVAAISYMDVWGTRRRARFEGNVFYNHNDAKNEYTIDRWYNAPSKLDTLHQESYSNPDNHTLRFRGRLRWKVARRHELTIIPSGNFRCNENLYRADSISRWGKSAPFDNPILNPNGNQSGGTSLTLGLYAQYYYRFVKDGRKLMFVTDVNRSTSDNDRTNYSASSKAPIPDSKWSYSRTFTDQATTNMRFQTTFQERIGRHVMLNMTYRLQGQWRDRDVLNYVTKSDYEVSNFEDYRVRTSSLYSGSHIYHQVGAGMRYGKRRNWFSVNMMYQYSEITTTDRRTDKSSMTKHHLPVFNATLNWAFDKSNSLRVSANSHLRVPGLWDKVDAYNLNNTSYISVGNPDLKPYTEYNAFARYTNVSHKHGTTLMLMAKAEYIDDYIGMKVVYSPGKIAIDGNNYSPLQLSQRVNLPGRSLYEGRISLGMPATAIKSNLNFTVGASYSDTPIEVIDSETTPLLDESGAFVARGSVEKMGALTGHAQVTLGSNISENVDFTLTWRGSYSRNTSTVEMLNNDFFTHYARLRMKVVLPLGFTISTLATFTHFMAITNKYQDYFTLWDLSIGKKVLKKKGEVELCVNDLLNQNTSFSRGVWISHSQVRYNSVLGRTFMVRFTYNLRNLSRNIRGDVPGFRRAKYDPLVGVQRKLNALRF
ncbi:MAG: TonB-dependent receptor [Alistipes sp.]|nr:TonB-dependent receptor [Alistipes sp.]